MHQYKLHVRASTPRGACGPLESRVRCVLWYHSCICLCGYLLMPSLQRGVFSVVKCAHMQSSKKVHRSFVCKSNADWWTNGWEFISSRNHQWSKSKVFKGQREFAVIPFIVFNTRFYFDSSCCNGPTTTTQVRVADTPVGPHTLDTASIWQQTLSAGRRAVRSPPADWKHAANGELCLAHKVRALSTVKFFHTKLR